MYCEYCGTHLEEGASFCPECGAKVDSQPAEERYCTHCGALMEKDDLFCTRCGMRADGEDADATIALSDMDDSAYETPVYGTGPSAYDKSAYGAPKKRRVPVWVFVAVGALVLALVIGFGTRAVLHRKKAKTETTETASSKGSKSTPSETGTKEDETGEAADDKDDKAGEDNADDSDDSPFYDDVEVEDDPAEEKGASVSGGIHKYELVIDDCTWTEACDRASSAGGYLARIESREELDHIINQINKEGKDRIQFKLGARRDESGSDYYWVDADNHFIQSGDALNSGTYWASDVWLANEPSYYDKGVGVDEMYLTMYYNKSVQRWVWNDVSNDTVSVVPAFSGKLGYIIEFE